MESVINPWFFYLVGVCDNINATIIFGIFICIACLIVFGIDYLVKLDNGYEDECKILEKKLKNKLYILMLLIIINIIIPSKEVIYQMVIAKQITYNNVQLTKETVKESIDYIFEKVETTLENNR